MNRRLCKKVLFVVDEFFPVSSAPAVRISSFVQAFKKPWDKLILCGAQNKSGPTLKREDASSTFYTMSRPSERSPFQFIWFLFKMVFTAVFLSIQNHPDIVVFSLPKYELLVGLLILSLLGKTCVLDLRDSHSFLNYEAYFQHFVAGKPSVLIGRIYKNGIGILLKTALKYSSLVTVANESIFSEIKSTYPLVAPKLRLVSNGVNVKIFQKDEKSRMVNESFTLIYVGNFAEKDRFDWIVEGVKSLRERGQNVNVLLVGDGRNIERIRTLIEEYKLTSQFLFIGKVTHTDVPAFILQAHIGIILRQKEVVASIPVCIFEYMAMEIPVIVNDVGRMAAFVQERGAGFVVQDELELIDLLDRLSKDRQTLKDIPKGLREWVVANASRDQIARIFFNEVTRIVEGS